MSRALPVAVSDKRQAIIEAAGELFAAQGYDRTTIAQIARRAGVAVGTVYLSYPTKRALRVQVSVAVQHRLAAALQPREQSNQALSQLVQVSIERLFDFCHIHRTLLRLVEVEQPSNDEARLLCVLTQQLTEMLQAVVQDAVVQDRLHPFRTPLSAQILATLIWGVAQQCFVAEEGHQEAAYQQGLIEVLDRLLFGLSPVSGGGTDQDQPLGHGA